MCAMFMCRAIRRRDCRQTIDTKRNDVSDAPSGELDDGRYDAFIVWAEQRDNGIALECAITAGAHRGDVVTIVSKTLPTKDELALVGLPCTLIVDAREIRVTFD